jgi:hypothetical protein
MKATAINLLVAVATLIVVSLPRATFLPDMMYMVPVFHRAGAQFFGWNKRSLVEI